MVEKEHRMLEVNGQVGYNNGYTIGYNDAIDDTVEAIKELYAFTNLEEEEIDEMARRLKLERQVVTLDKRRDS